MLDLAPTYAQLMSRTPAATRRIRQKVAEALAPLEALLSAGTAMSPLARDTTAASVRKLRHYLFVIDTLLPNSAAVAEVGIRLAGDNLSDTELTLLACAGAGVDPAVFVSLA